MLVRYVAREASPRWNAVPVRLRGTDLRALDCEPALLRSRGRPVAPDSRMARVVRTLPEVHRVGANLPDRGRGEGVERVRALCRTPRPDPARPSRASMATP